MKTWDWEVAKGKFNEHKFKWLWLNHDKKISEEEFVHVWRGFKKFSVQQKKRGNVERSVLHSRYAPSQLKRDYRNLKANFGFFV